MAGTARSLNKSVAYKDRLHLTHYDLAYLITENITALTHWMGTGGTEGKHRRKIRDKVKVERVKKDIIRDVGQNKWKLQDV